LKEDTQVGPWSNGNWNIESFNTFAIDYLKTIPKRKYENEDHCEIERVFTSKPWWDTVDVFASNIVGTYFQTCPQMISLVISK